MAIDSIAALKREPQLGLLLAGEAVRATQDDDRPVPVAEQALRGVLSLYNGSGVINYHNASISGVAFSPDASQLAVASFDGTVSIWHLEALEPIMMAILKGSFEPIVDMGFSPDGRFLVTSSGHGIVDLWESATGVMLTRIRGASAITRIVISPDGRYLITGEENSSVSVWDLATGQPVTLLARDAEAVTAMAVSPDGRWLAIGSRDSTIHIWKSLDRDNSKSILLRSHNAMISTLAFSPNGHWLAAGSMDGTASLWDWNAPAADPMLLRGHEDAINYLVISPDAHWLVTGSWDETARLWDLRAPNPAEKSIRLLGGGAINTYQLAQTPVYSLPEVVMVQHVCGT